MFYVIHVNQARKEENNMQFPSLGMAYEIVLRENVWKSLRRLTADLEWIQCSRY
jgi:hypothetical protein